jgi:hypothetical protein
MPLVVFILLAVVCLALFGFACACLSDHPMQTVERTLAGVPALVEVWSLVALIALAAAAFAASATSPRARAPSPASLQRFLL